MRKLIYFLIIILIACLLFGCGTTVVSDSADTGVGVTQTETPSVDDLIINENYGTEDVTVNAKEVNYFGPYATVRLYSRDYSDNYTLIVSTITDYRGDFSVSTNRTSYDNSIIYLTLEEISKTESDRESCFF